MGCYDTVILECPACRTRIKYQSKDGEGWSRTYGLYNAPPQILGGMIGEKITCDNCHKLWIVAGQVIVQLVGIVEDEGYKPDQETIATRNRFCGYW